MRKTAIILSILLLIVGSCKQSIQKQEAETAKQSPSDSVLITDKQENEPTTEIDKTNEYYHFAHTSQDINLYRLWDLEYNIKRKVGFITLSEDYPLSDHIDSLAIPDLSDWETEKMEYFKLSSKYRKRFIERTKISETDTVFVYDYSTDVLRAFPVKTLNVVAYLNVYMSVDNCPCNQYDYYIGFEIGKDKLIGFGESYGHVLVNIGKENPFFRGQMKAIVWKRISSNDFPLEKANGTIIAELRSNAGLTKGLTFLYEFENFNYFIQSWTDAQYNGASHKMYEISKRHLLVVDKKSGEVVVEKLFENREGSLPTPLNFGIEFEHNVEDDYTTFREQWTGKLFKNKPPVVFGFEWLSFSCPGITFLSKTEGEIGIRCDNRH
jgi:hypothetical protein